MNDMNKAYGKEMDSNYACFLCHLEEEKCLVRKKNRNRKGEP